MRVTTTQTRRSPIRLRRRAIMPTTRSLSPMSCFMAPTISITPIRSSQRVHRALTGSLKTTRPVGENMVASGSRLATMVSGGICNGRPTLHSCVRMPTERRLAKQCRISLIASSRNGVRWRRNSFFRSQRSLVFRRTRSLRFTGRNTATSRLQRPRAWQMAT